MSDWPFHDPPNVAVIANKRIIDKHACVACVSHDAEDGMWQFHTGEEAELRSEDAVVVSLRSIVLIDPTLKDLVATRPPLAASH